MATDSHAQSNIYLDNSDHPILHAAFGNDLGTLRDLLGAAGKAEYLECTNWLGCGALRLAATAGHLAACRLLVAGGADIEQACVKAVTPLGAAIRNNHLHCAQYLLDQGAAPDGNPRHANTLLYNAVLQGNILAVKLLIRYGATIDSIHPQPGAYACPLLSSCISYHQLTCFTLLIKAGADPDFFAREPSRRQCKSCQSLYFAVILHNCDVPFAELLYHSGASLYLPDDTGKLARDVDSDKACAAYIKALYTQPRPLASCCRLLIRRRLGRSRLTQLHSLPLPPRLVHYLDLDLDVDVGDAENDMAWERRQVAMP